MTWTYTKTKVKNVSSLAIFHSKACYINNRCPLHSGALQIIITTYYLVYSLLILLLDQAHYMRCMHAEIKASSYAVVRWFRRQVLHTCAVLSNVLQGCNRWTKLASFASETVASILTFNWGPCLKSVRQRCSLFSGYSGFLPQLRYIKAVFH